jgi:hypothetical protein
MQTLPTNQSFQAHQHDPPFRNIRRYVNSKIDRSPLNNSPHILP